MASVKCNDSYVFPYFSEGSIFKTFIQVFEPYLAPRFLHKKAKTISQDIGWTLLAFPPCQLFSLDRQGFQHFRFAFDEILQSGQREEYEKSMDYVQKTFHIKEESARTATCLFLDSNLISNQMEQSS